MAKCASYPVFEKAKAELESKVIALKNRSLEEVFKAHQEKLKAVSAHDSSLYVQPAREIEKYASSLTDEVRDFLDETEGNLSLQTLCDAFTTIVARNTGLSETGYNLALLTLGCVWGNESAQKTSIYTFCDSSVSHFQENEEALKKFAPVESDPKVDL
jgi:hypothetical protein